MRTLERATTTKGLTLANVPWQKMAVCSVNMLGSLPAAYPAALPTYCQPSSPTSLLPTCLPTYAYLLPAAYRPIYLCLRSAYRPMPACCLPTSLLPAYLLADCRSPTYLIRRSRGKGSHRLAFLQRWGAVDSAKAKRRRQWAKWWRDIGTQMRRAVEVVA